VKVQLEEGLWIKIEGNELATKIESHAKEFGTMKEALSALKEARQNFDYPDAAVEDSFL